MTGRQIVVAGTFVAALGVSAIGQKLESAQNANLVDLDVVVTDGGGRPVAGLKQEDFDVREDGKRVKLTTFIPVADDADGDSGRSLVILLDDVTMPRESVNAIKAIATYLAMQARSTDDLSVLRFTRQDEPIGDRRAALARIAEFEGAPIRYAPAGSPEDVLELIANVSRQLESTGRRRKIIICIGAPRICNVTQPGGFGGGWFYDAWRDAIGAAARANVSVYALLAVPARVSGKGIVEATGGAIFHGESDFRPVLDRIWQDAGQHYLLGYWPPASSKDVHTISVKVARKGVKVLARRQRGN